MMARSRSMSVRPAPRYSDYILLMAMDTFAPGARVFFLDGDRTRYGVVQSVETIDGVQVVVIKVDGGGPQMKLPVASISRAG
ncbi:hypothetical protein A0H81_04123 [Grifola frondosa]|uniref:Uncharacterized protein n=1 Tax=Grifola frondosa TaxID=5627 RepID=A0A1C7MG34_GRIFR|nr:hypothetical protein A0H81_04123 [Grifola frondosa]